MLKIWILLVFFISTPNYIYGCHECPKPLDFDNCSLLDNDTRQIPYSTIITTYQSLPDDILKCIFTYLDIETLLCIAQVNKKHSQLTRTIEDEMVQHYYKLLKKDSWGAYIMRFKPKAYLSIFGGFLADFLKMQKAQTAYNLAVHQKNVTELPILRNYPYFEKNHNWL